MTQEEQGTHLNCVIHNDDVRESIPYELFDLLNVFAENKWDITINTESALNIVDDSVTVVYAGTEDWNGLFIHDYKVGYITEHATLTQTIRRLAELCLRLKETFTDTLPSIYIKDDMVSSDDDWHAEASKGKEEALRFLCERQKDLPEDSTQIDDTFSSIYTDKKEFLMSANVISRLINTLESVND